MIQENFFSLLQDNANSNQVPLRYGFIDSVFSIIRYLSVMTSPLDCTASILLLALIAHKK